MQKADDLVKQAINQRPLFKLLAKKPNKLPSTQLAGFNAQLGRNVVLGDISPAYCQQLGGSTLPGKIAFTRGKLAIAGS